MKIAAAILVLFGIGNLAGAVPMFLDGTSVIEALLAFLIGCLALLVAVGILKKKRFAWSLGFALIASSALYFVASVMPFALQKEGVERTVLLAGCSIGAILVGVFWSVLWHRQRRYFSPDEERA